MEHSSRLCDILNLQANKINPNDLEETNTAWELIKTLFMDNVRSHRTIEICFVVQNNKKVFFSINDSSEHEVQIAESELLNSMDIARLHGLIVHKLTPDVQNSNKVEDEPEYFIYFTFIPSIL